MKINKGMSVLLASMLVGGMLVGCGHNNTDTTKALTKTVENIEKDNKTTKDKEEEKASSEDNKENSNKEHKVTKKDNTKVTTKKDTKKDTSNTKEKPIYDEYGYDQYGNYNPNKDLYNDREWSDDDHKRWEEAHGDDCSICGGHVGGKEMCECDGTIHHRTCHIDAYTCPSCNRYGLKHDPDIYGCPYCGYPVEDYDDYDDYDEPNDVEEYNEEEEYYE